MNFFTSDKKVTRFSSTAYCIFTTILALGGLASSLLLARSHYRNFTDIGYQSFCAISRSLNCDTVSQSPYAVIGGAPLAVWGAVGYLLVLVLIAFFWSSIKMIRGWATILSVAILFSLISLFLAVVSSVLIRSYCLMCMATYGINLVMLLVSWLALRRFGDGTWLSELKNDLALFKERSRTVLFGGIAFFLILPAIGLFYPKYWRYLDLSTTLPLMNQGVTEDGSPWIGAQDPLLTITEFADYMCFQCGKMHNHLRQLVSQYPDRIRLVHRHFPLDPLVNPIVKETVHPGSGMVSLFAILAQESGNFWQVNDLLFRDAREKKSINFGEIARTTGLDPSNFQKRLDDNSLITKLMEDIRDGAEHGITATPSYLIGGQRYNGTIPEDVLAQALKDE